MGKRALRAEWLARREAAGTPGHITSSAGARMTGTIRRSTGSLVAQTAALFPVHPEPEADARRHPAARL
jgi:hypothetical protein